MIKKYIRANFLIKLVFVFFLFTLQVNAQSKILNNGIRRIGNGAENSINASGNMQQPFYYNSTLALWRKLTYSIYPLDIRWGVGGVGTNNWNVNGSLVENPVVSNIVYDYSGFTHTNLTPGDGYGTIKFTGNITINGQLFLLENTYTLGQTSGFFRIKNKITNVSGTTASNVRLWLGTRDDWVGATDGPTKERGNIVGTAFQVNTLATVQAKALKITSGDEAVLFFSNSPRAHTSINSCCAFANAANQDPSTSAITLTNDGSYAVYVRFSDLLNGQSDEIETYYASGTNAEIIDIIAEIANIAGSINTVTCDSAIYTYSTTVGGTTSYVVIPSAGTAPTAAQIEAGVSYPGATVISSGNAVTAANVNYNFNLNSLTSNTAYKVYGVTKYFNGVSTVFSSIQNSNFTTFAYPSTPTTSSVTQPTCAVPTGTIVLTAQTDMEYSINNGGTYQASPTFAGLAPGTYTLRVRRNDAYTCQTVGASTVTINATATPAIPTTSSVIQPTCAVTSGTIVFTTQTNVTYSINNGTSYQASPTFAGLAPGTYTLRVRSTIDTTCSTQAASTITINAVPTVPTAPTVSSTTQPTCGVPTGTIVFTTQAGVEYSINNGTSYQASPTFAGLAAGTYTLRVRSTTDTTCSTQAASTVTINTVPTPPSVPTTASVVQPTCAVTTGTIVFTTQTNVTYSINNGTSYQASPTFAGLAPGTYTLRVRSTIDTTCSTQAASTLTINAATPPTIPTTASVVQPTCAVLTGTIVFTTQAGVEYSINNGTSYQASPTFAGLAAGTYTLRVRSTTDTTCSTQAASTVVIVGLLTTDSDSDGIYDVCDLDDDNDGILDTTECNIACSDQFSNGDFELPNISLAPYNSNSVVTLIQANAFGWQTTATDNLIEFWRSGFQGTPSASGNQFVELNASQQSTLYQTFCLNGSAGNVTWALKHRGRIGVDVANVKMGSSLASATIVQSMTDNNTAWGSYSGNYTIPPGQSVLIIAFESVSSAGGNQTVGNFLDDVQISIVQGCADSDGDGIPNNLEIDSDNDGCTDANEYYNNTTASGTDGGMYGTGAPAVNSNGQVTAASYTGTYTNVITAGSASSITMQPANQLTSVGGVATFSVVATGGSGTRQFQWQESTNNGTSWTNVANGGVYSGATTASLTITGATLAMVGYDYRVIITQSDFICANVVSSSANLCVVNTPTVASTTQPTCAVPTGTIVFTTQTGVEYSINNGTSYQSNPTFTGLAAGTYTLRVRSTTDTTCSTQAAATVTINAIPTAPTVPTVASTTQPTCAVPTGTIVFTTQAGVEYSINNGTSYQASPTFAGLVAGTYTLRVRSTTDTTCSTQAAATVTISAVSCTNLAITKTVSNSAPTTGSTIVFTIVATNLGFSNATGVVVNDLLPNGYNYVSSAPSVGSYTSGTGVWSIGNLANGASETLTVNAIVLTTGSYINTATIAGNEIDNIISNNSYSASVLPQLSCDKIFTPVIIKN